MGKACENSSSNKFKHSRAELSTASRVSTHSEVVEVHSTTQKQSRGQSSNCCVLCAWEWVTTHKGYVCLEGVQYIVWVFISSDSLPTPQRGTVISLPFLQPPLTSPVSTLGKCKACLLSNMFGLSYVLEVYSDVCICKNFT